jgi:hypothetical protein
MCNPSVYLFTYFFFVVVIFESLSKAFCPKKKKKKFEMVVGSWREIWQQRRLIVESQYERSRCFNENVNVKVIVSIETNKFQAQNFLQI